MAIPVAIHLWNVRKGRTRKIGSIRFFAETAVSRARSLQLTALWLLLLRCLIFAFIAGFIARPFILSNAVSRGKGWLLVDRTELGPVYRQYQQEIDSLLEAGAELREFGAPFGPIALSDSIRENARQTSYWESLEQLQHKIVPGTPVFLYTENKLSLFEGTRPGLSLDLHWKTALPADSTARWIEVAYQGTGDSVFVVSGTTGPGGNQFSDIALPSSDPAISNDGTRLSMDGKTANIDTSTLAIGIYGESGAPDLRYLEGAIRAYGTMTKRKLEIVRVDKATGAELNWLFWLSLDTVPASIKAEKVLRYAGGQAVPISTVFSAQEDGPLVPIYKIRRTENGEHIPLWLAATGDPVMEIDPQAGHYRFYSAFDPTWNELVWGDEFPKLISRLLHPASAAERIDKRMIDPQQVQPVRADRSGLFASENKDLSKSFWVIAFVLFLLERWLAYKKQRRAHG